MFEFAASNVAPLYWAVRTPQGEVTSRNGTAFFLQTGKALFGVTAAHVVEGSNSWREHCKVHGKTPLRLGAKNGTSIGFDWDDRVIDINLEIDIATFRISHREIAHIERTPYGGLQNTWPPPPPVGRIGMIYAGFPGIGTRHFSREALQFGVVCGMGMISSVSPRNVSSLIEREYLEPALGEGVMPENFNFGGISGGPMLQVLMKGGLFLNALAGVIYSGPNTSANPDEAIPGFELIRARPTAFIREDGMLDHALWASL